MGFAWPHEAAIVRIRVGGSLARAIGIRNLFYAIVKFIEIGRQRIVSFWSSRVGEDVREDLL